MYFGQTISGWIRGFLLIMFLLALFGIAGSWYGAVVLVPDAVIPGLEVWRVATYPLALAFGSLLISFVVFSMPGEELEAMFGRSEFGRLIAIVTIGVGLLHSLFFFGMPAPRLAGLINTSLFIYAIYVYLYPASRVRVIFFSLRSVLLGALLLAAAMVIAGLEVANGGHPGLFLSGGLYGAVAGVVYAQVRFQKFEIASGLISKLKGRSAGRTGLSIVQKTDRAEAPERKRDSDRLDEILEKISERGYDSLSADEREFLREYSSRI